MFFLPSAVRSCIPIRMNDLFCVYSTVQQIPPIIKNTKTYVTADSVLEFAVFANVHFGSIGRHSPAC